MQTIIKSFSDLNTRELYQILKLRVDVFVVEQNCPYPELDDKDQKSKHYWLEDDNQIVAYLRTYPKGSSTYAIGRIVTNANFRGRGLGKVLIQKAIDDIKEITGVSEIFMQAQSHLIVYYRSFGFEACSEEYLEDDIPHTDLQILL